MAQKTTDKWVNVYGQTIVMSAANTLTFSEVPIGVSLFDKAGLVIHRVEVDVYAATLADLDTDSDYFQVGLSQSNVISALAMTDNRVIDLITFRRQDGGAAANYTFVTTPIIHDLSTLPGGGLLTAPRPLYLAMTSGGMTIAGGAVVRIYYTLIPLADSDYYELLETRRALT